MLTLSYEDIKELFAIIEVLKNKNLDFNRKIIGISIAREKSYGKKIINDSINSFMKTENIEYDIIFLDHVLPDIDGIEIARVLKRIDGYVIPPIVAFTANVMNGIREKYLAAGFDEYLAKPIEISQFNNVVKKFCEVKKPEQEVVQAQETVTQAN